MTIGQIVTAAVGAGAIFVGFVGPHVIWPMQQPPMSDECRVYNAKIENRDVLVIPLDCDYTAIPTDPDAGETLP